MQTTNEAGKVLSFTSNLRSFIMDSKLLSLQPSSSSVPSSFLCFDTTSSKRQRLFRASSCSSLGPTTTASMFRNMLFHELNRAVKLTPLGFASLGIHPIDHHCNNGGSVVLEDDGKVATKPKGSKNVLILMSDTGGGHRASAEAIKTTFNEEFGDQYNVFVTDLWSDHTPWPFNQLPRSYSFLVKHGPLWKMAYYGTAPRLVHQSNFAATSTFIARKEE